MFLTTQRTLVYSEMRLLLTPREKMVERDLEAFKFLVVLKTQVSPPLPETWFFNGMKFRWLKA